MDEKRTAKCSLWTDHLLTWNYLETHHIMNFVAMENGDNLSCTRYMCEPSGTHLSDGGYEPDSHDPGVSNICTGECGSKEWELERERE